MYKELTFKHITLECPKFNSSRQILENPSRTQQALDEENSKNIYNFFYKHRLSKITVKKINTFTYILHTPSNVKHNVFP